MLDSIGYGVKKPTPTPTPIPKISTNHDPLVLRLIVGQKYKFTSTQSVEEKTATLTKIGSSTKEVYSENQGGYGAQLWFDEKHYFKADITSIEKIH